MIYYNQVVGLSALSVSFIVMVSLMCDALFDPMIGHISDSFRSRMGRRLPFMYASALPLTVCFVLLWLHPVGWSHGALQVYVIVCLLGVRLFDTLFELPHIALVPELTSDYHDRTRLFMVRSLFESATGLAISALAYNVLLRANPDGSGGILSAQGYPMLGLVCGAIIFASIIASTAGMHRWAPIIAAQLPEASGDKGWSRDVVATVKTPSFAVLVAAFVLISIATGIGSTLNLYWMIYYYRFTQAEMTLLSVPALVGFSLTVLTPTMCRRLGKRNGAIMLCWIYVATMAAPMIARTLGWVQPDSGALLGLVAAQCLLAPASIIMMLVVLSSMISDTVEEVEIRTGRRSEGLLLSSVSFIRKLTSGIGALVGGAILAVASFPKVAQRLSVPEATLNYMAWLYLAIKVTLLVGTTVILLRYKYTEKMHRADVATLRNAARMQAQHKAGLAPPG